MNIKELKPGHYYRALDNTEKGAVYFITGMNGDRSYPIGKRVTNRGDLLEDVAPGGNSTFEEITAEQYVEQACLNFRRRLENWGVK